MAGFSLIELLIVIALIIIVTAIGAPFYLSYQQAQETSGAARELITALNQARQLAITRSNSFSVETQTNPQNRWRLCSGTYDTVSRGAVVTGPGTDASAGPCWTTAHASPEPADHLQLPWARPARRDPCAYRTLLRPAA